MVLDDTGVKPLFLAHAYIHYTGLCVCFVVSLSLSLSFFLLFLVLPFLSRLIQLSFLSFFPLDILVVAVVLWWVREGE